MNEIIAHISDVHIRFGSRYEEYEIVFNRTIESLEKLKPKRIVITGDLFHTKINLSPNSIKIAGKFLKKLSKIAPVDVSPGNHDWNSQSPAQGNSIEAIVELIPNGFVITKDLKTIPAPEQGNGIYFYKDSGFYNIDKNIIYGVYSCFDNEILTLTKKIKNKKYIALYHGPLQGCIGDNGYELKGDEYIKKSAFNNFDMVFLGDIHEHQSFSNGEVENMAYAGSILQMNYGESHGKGYLIWNIENNTFERRLILNDHGFTKLNITAGEDIDRRIREMPVSFDPRKTKVNIDYEDYEENYSIELLKQIEHKVKTIHKCEYVAVDWISLLREAKEGEEEIMEIDYSDTDQFESLLEKFLEEKDYDDIDEVLQLSKEIDSKLNVENLTKTGARWEPVKLIARNLYMFPDKEIVFDFDKRKGVTGVLGENYTGKSNVIRVLIWTLYKKMLGGGKSHKLVNMYTDSNKGYAEFHLKIASELYRIIRTVTVKVTKKEEYDVSYGIKYEKFVSGEWKIEDSDENATQKKEAEKVIIEALGTFEDFVKVALKSQGSDGGYLTLAQQPKNDLVNKYLGLEVFRSRYEIANDKFKKIKATQKALGDPVQIEEDIKKQNENVNAENKILGELDKEKKEINKKIDDYNKDILEQTKKITKIENLEETDENIVVGKIEFEKKIKLNEETQIPLLEDYLKKNFKKEVPKVNSEKWNIETDKEIINQKIQTQEAEKKKEEARLPELEVYVSKNFKKEALKSNINTTKEQAEIDLENKREDFKKEKTKYTTAEIWLKDKVKKDVIDTNPIEIKIKEIEEALTKLKDKLIVSKGKKCPTCNTQLKKADPVLQKDCETKILRGEKSLKEKQIELKNAKDIIKDNNDFDIKTNEKNSSKNSLTKLKSEIDKLKEHLELQIKISNVEKHNKEVDEKNNELTALKNSIKYREDFIIHLEACSKISDINIHNKEIETKTNELDKLRKSIVSREKEIERLKSQKDLLIKNKSALEENIKINAKIKEIESDIKIEKTIILQLDEKIKESNANVKVSENNIENFKEKVSTLRQSEKIYKKYSVYMQAVHRDGIPAQIIRKKLPIINHRINNLLRNVVKFKIELFVKPNGDIEEMFYFGENKKFSLPLSMSSGSQGFLGSVAIQDALHFVSKLSKPSLCIIDEGFGSLDEKHTMDIDIILNYFRGRYKNTLIITHKNEIKDFVDNIINVTKTTEGLTKEQLKENPQGGISIYDMS